MAGHNYAAVDDHLVRSEIWSAMLKERLEETLMAQQYVNWIDFPDGTTLTIPSIGAATVRDYVDDTPVTYDKFDTGEFQFNTFFYKSAGTYITDKAKMDSYYAAQLESRFVPEMQLALEKAIESDVWEAMDSQTAGSTNAINGASHRLVGSADVGDENQQLGPNDFALARLAFMKANVPLSNLVAFVPPETAHVWENGMAYAGTAGSITTLITPQPNPIWEPVIRDGLVTGTRFAFSIYGFDVYVSDFLPDVAAGTNINGTSLTNAGKKCYFFSAADKGQLSNVLGVWRQPPRVESERNKDMQRDEYVVTARYGLQGGYRPENLVVCAVGTGIT